MKLKTGICSSILAAAIVLFTGITARAQSPKATSFNTSTPSRFTENKGQVTDQNGRPRSDVKYIYSDQGMKVIFKENSFCYEMYTIEKHAKISEATGKPVNDMKQDKLKEPDPITVRTHRVDITLPGAARRPQIISEGRSSDYTNYYLAHTTEEGVQNVFGYSKLTYKNIWPKVDLVFYARKKGELKYDIVLHPGAKLSDVKFAYAGMKGLTLEEGKLKIRTALGEAEESVPVSYLKEDGTIVNAGMRAKGNIVGYQAYGWDGVQTLVIDPVLKWGTYAGGEDDDLVNGIASDASSNVVISGLTYSATGIATSGAHQTTYGGGYYDAFITKFSISGTRIWSTYYGGKSGDEGGGVAIDASGNVIATGWSQSPTGIATTGAHLASNAGGYDAYVVKFNSTGSRQWGTYYGGNGSDEGVAVTLDILDNILVVGRSHSTSGIATPGVHQTTNSGFADVFVVKFNNSGKRQWGTYYGGNNWEEGYGIAIDQYKNVYITGRTESTNGIASSGAFKTTFAGGSQDAFLAKFDSSGVRQWSTYFGGSNFDNGLGVFATSDGSVMLTGSTQSSSGISTAGAHQSLHGGNADAFVAKFNSSGKQQWSTYYGSAGSDVGIGVIENTYGELLVSGYTTSATGIATPGAYQTTKGGNEDVFIVKFDSSGARKWGTYYGGGDTEESAGLTIDNSGNIFCAGNTASSNGIATLGASQTSFAGVNDGFVARFYEKPSTDIALVGLSNFPSSICTEVDLPIHVVLENKTSMADSNIRVKISITGPENFTVTDSLVKGMDGGAKDTLRFNGQIRFSKPGTYSVVVFRDPADSDPSNDTLKGSIEVRSTPQASFQTSQKVHFVVEFTPDDTLQNNYLWDFGGGNTSTDKKPIHDFQQAGSYAVTLKVTSAEGCISEVTDTVVVQTSSVSDHSLPQYSVTVYPNPFDNNLNIRYTLMHPGNVSMELLDITGRVLIRSEKGQQPAGEQTITLSTSDNDLQPGVYMLRLKFGNQTVMQKVVKAAGGY